MTVHSRLLSSVASWNDWWHRPYGDPARVHRFQAEQIRWLVARAVNVPYYAALFRNAGFKAEDIRDVSDLRHVPVSSKRDFLETPIEHLMTPGTDLNSCLILHSSGSTGEPSVIVRSHPEQRTLRLYALRAALQADAEPWERRAFIRTDVFKPTALQQAGMFPFVNISSRQDMDLILADLHRLRPEIICSFPHLLVRLALEYTSREKRFLNVRRVVASGETFTPTDCEVVHEAFGCDVFDAYGLQQCELAAWDCPYCGLYHLSEDSVIVEVLVGDRPAQPGEEGRAVYTPLHSLTAPLLRFETGDLVRLPKRPRPCRIRFRQVESFVGRRRSYLPTPENTWISPIALTNAIRKVSGLGWFQIQQPALDRVVVLYEALRGSNGEVKGRIPETLQSFFPPSMDLTAQAANSFEFTPGGKLQTVQPFRAQGGS
jgi:phenylacetate-CoA ligase